MILQSEKCVCGVGDFAPQPGAVESGVCRAVRRHPVRLHVVDHSLHFDPQPAQRQGVVAERRGGHLEVHQLAEVAPERPDKALNTMYKDSIIMMIMVVMKMLIDARFSSTVEFESEFNQTIIFIAVTIHHRISKLAAQFNHSDAKPRRNTPEALYNGKCLPPTRITWFVELVVLAPGPNEPLIPTRCKPRQPCLHSEKSRKKAVEGQGKAVERQWKARERQWKYSGRPGKGSGNTVEGQGKAVENQWKARERQ